MTMNGTTTDTQAWRAELAATLAAKEQAEREAEEAEKQQKIASRNQYIDAVIEFAKWLGIEGEIRELKPVGKQERPMPLIVRDGYAFEFSRVEFKTIKPGNMAARNSFNSNKGIVPPDTEQSTVSFWLTIKRTAVKKDECPLNKCQHTHMVQQSTNNGTALHINMTTGAGKDDFNLKLAAALRDLDTSVPYQQKNHAQYLAREIRSAEEEAYYEKARREYVPPAPEPEIDHEESEPEHAKPALRERVIYEGSWEWRMLELFEEMRAGYDY